MENAMYIISFGNSMQYRLVVPCDSNHSKEITHLEKNMLAYLEKKFPIDVVKYLAEAKVECVDPKDYAKYESYPPLDADAISKIKKVLDTGIEVDNATKKLDNNELHSA
uniref:Uncharacterized protein n=1 Tax=uncultured Muribaculaceae bacterium TaxID=2301481 RepID=A0A6G8F3G5_9BACT|nr:hypothetical protein Muribac1_0390 [uncultured Muribaculaceae bacterium]